MFKSITTLILLHLILLTPSFAQSAESILKKVSAKHEEMMEKTQDMKVTMRPEGDMISFERIVTYYKKEMVNGEPFFKSYSEYEGMGERMMTMDDDQSLDMLGFGAKMYDALKDVAEVRGMETVEGKKTHVLYVPDMTGLMEDALGGMAGADEASQLKDAYIYIDQSRHVIRRITMVAQIENEGQMVDMDIDVTMSDYRQVGPVYQPFVVKSMMQNPMSPAQRAEFQMQRAQMEEMLKNMPEEQQAQMKKMIEAMGKDQIEITMVVEDLQVNKGVPAEFFE